MSPPRLHAEITAHGFGHLAQTAPVLNALRRQMPALQLSIGSGLPRERLAEHVHGDFRHISRHTDIGMLMRSAVEVNIEESAAAYAGMHAQRETHMSEFRSQYVELRPDLVLVNAPWLPIAAAHGLRIPVTGLSSLDWASVFERYCGDRPGAGEVLAHMRESYTLAQPFLRPQPAYLDIAHLHCHAVGPIARLGENRRAIIDNLLHPAHRRRLVLVALGGIPTRLPVQHWPRLAGVTFVAPEPVPSAREDWTTPHALGVSFLDALASADVVVTKPGYGTFAEAVCNATRVLYSPRPEWPEEPLLSDWLQEHGVARSLPRETLWSGHFAGTLEALLEEPLASPLKPSGVKQAAELLAARWTD